MTILLSLFAAVSYGLGDFNGGIFSKRGGPWAVSLMAQAGGTLLEALQCLRPLAGQLVLELPGLGGPVQFRMHAVSPVFFSGVTRSIPFPMLRRNIPRAGTA